MNRTTTWIARFERLANLRDESLDQLLDRLEIDREVVRLSCESSNGPDWMLLRKFADNFEITLDDLIDGRIDEEWVREPKLNESFRAEEGSRLRTSLPVVQWIESNYGSFPTTSLLRSLRIPRDTFRNPNQPVKLRLLCSLLQAAKARGVPDASLFEMGVAAINIEENRPIRDLLAQSRTPLELYECFLGDLMPRFESNYDYQLAHRSADSVTMAITPRSERIAENGQNITFDRSLSTYRWGVAAGLIQAIGRPATRLVPIVRATLSNPTEWIRLEWNDQAAIPLSRSRSRFPSVSV